MWEAAQALMSASPAPESPQAGKREATQFFSWVFGAELFIQCHKISTFLKKMGGDVCRGAGQHGMENILAAARNIVNHATGASAFIDMSFSYQRLSL